LKLGDVVVGVLLGAQEAKVRRRGHRNRDFRSQQRNRHNAGARAPASSAGLKTVTHPPAYPLLWKDKQEFGYGVES
jgi:hypothetical protein